MRARARDSGGRAPLPPPLPQQARSLGASLVPRGGKDEIRKEIEGFSDENPFSSPRVRPGRNASSPEGKAPSPMRDVGGRRGAPARLPPRRRRPRSHGSARQAASRR